MPSQAVEKERNKWTRLLEIANPWQREWFTDDEAAAASSLSVRGLRTVQAIGLIRSENPPRARGARIRMWSVGDVLRASLVAEFTNFGGIAAPTAIRLLKLIPEWVTEELVEQTAVLVSDVAQEPERLITEYGWFAKGERRVATEKGDIRLVIVDRRYVFLEGRFPELKENARPGVGLELVGLVRNVYSGKPIIRAVSGTPSAPVHRRLEKTHKNPISAHYLNLELALRWRITKALGLSVTR